MFLCSVNVTASFFTRWKVRIGDRNHISPHDDGNLQILQIVNSFVHREFDNKTSYFDVAVIETEKIKGDVSPVCLPNEESFDVNKYNNDLAELIGWGSSVGNGHVSSTLRRASLKVFSQR